MYVKMTPYNYRHGQWRSTNYCRQKLRPKKLNIDLRENARSKHQTFKKYTIGRKIETKTPSTVRSVVGKIN